jgi:hypothetical protein
MIYKYIKLVSTEFLYRSKYDIRVNEVVLIVLTSVTDQK